MQQLARRSPRAWHRWFRICRAPEAVHYQLRRLTHELLLDELHYRGKPRAFTWNSIDTTFGDPATEATRIATGERSFDPRPAYDRFKRHLPEDPTV